MQTVLIVGPDASVRAQIAAAVDWNALGFSVPECASDEAGLSAALRCRPDLIVTELCEPGPDGFRMLQALRDAGIRSPAVILSAYGEFSLAQRAMRLGAADYLLLPLQPDELQRAVARIHRIDEPPSPAEEKLPALNVGSGLSRYVTEAIAYIAVYYGNSGLTVGMIAEHLHISEGHLSHVFKRETDFTLVEYLAQYRIREAARLLKDVRMKIYEVAQTVGYRDVAYFSGAFRRFLGCTPSEYQRAYGIF